MLSTILKMAVFAEKCKPSPLQKKRHWYFIIDVLSYKRWKNVTTDLKYNSCAIVHFKAKKNSEKIYQLFQPFFFFIRKELQTMFLPI